ncbi:MULTISPECIES: hypothetical protein [Actinoplanes]|uniref:hypothetical protein n=1 Tax=Actinoplanes TaxID=1865 RepID=UPI0005F2841D|nr:MULTISPECIES: hypothetical protein [Actinoplanes]GLY00853.1 hypothetical protein Acsp01_12320 [Actinoplanes sp. NBRC 101535]
MRYATPTRSAHRAAPAGLALFVRLPGPIGQHRYRPRVRPRPQRHVRHEPDKTVHLLNRGLAALIVLGICVMLGILVFADQRRAPSTGDNDTGGADRLIASRTADPVPLTATEVFPTGAAGFVVGATDVRTDCTTAVTGALRVVLAGTDCSQAVRAELTAPDGHRVTAGVLNLLDERGAAGVDERVGRLVETGDGGFTAMAGTEIPPGTPVVWRVRGHYLLYGAITGPGGEPAATDRAAVDRITATLLDGHLGETVLGARSR